MPTRRLCFLVGLFFCALPGPARTGSAAQGSEVPLELYTNAHWPAGVPIGRGFGVAFLDFDRDGWVDLYSHLTGSLWRNDKGRTWALAADLDAFLPPTPVRYGASCADYDNDGLPDIATEQYGDCFYFLKNLGHPGQRGQPLLGEPRRRPALARE